VNEGRTVFSQLIEHLPDCHYRRIVARNGGNRRARRFSCWDQHLFDHPSPNSPTGWASTTSKPVGCFGRRAPAAAAPRTLPGQNREEVWPILHG